MTKTPTSAMISLNILELQRANFDTSSAFCFWKRTFHFIYFII